MRKISGVTIALFLVASNSPTPASAEWISGGSAVASAGIAVGSLLFGPFSPWIIGGACVAEVGGIATDAAIHLSSLDGGPQPSYLAGPPPALFGSEAIIVSTYQPFALPGGPGDALVSATNQMISALDTLDGDFNAGAPSAQLIGDIQSMAGAFSSFQSAYDALGVTQTITQADINSFQASIATSGLPSVETQFMQNAGVSAAAIQSFADYTASIPVNLSGPSVTFDQVLSGQIMDFNSVPEPGSLLLVLTGLPVLSGGVGLALWRRASPSRRKRDAAAA